MTATVTPTLHAPRRGPSLALVGRLAHGAATVMAGLGARWNDFVDAGQLGPSPDSTTSRHTGARI